MHEVPDIAANAALAATQYQRLSSVPLDFSPESVHGIDEAVAFTAANAMAQLSNEQLIYFVELMGSYLLEVARREFGGTYKFYEPTSEPVLVIETDQAQVAIGMISKVGGRLSDPADHLPFHYAGIGESLARGGAVLIL